MLDATIIRLKSDQGDYLAVNETDKNQLYFTTGMEIWIVKFPKIQNYINIWPKMNILQGHYCNF